MIAFYIIYGFAFVVGCVTTAVIAASIASYLGDKFGNWINRRKVKR